MNRNLREVRRYWPKAKRSKSGARFWAVGGRVNLTLVADVWEVDFASDTPLPALKHIGATIPEAMRAAGFGPRPLGKFARQRQIRTLTRRQSSALWGFPASLTGDDPVRLATRQRPRKGVRPGKRKRELRVKPVSCGWHAAVSEIVATFGGKLFPALLVKPLADAAISMLPLALSNMRSPRPPELLVVDDVVDVEVASFTAPQRPRKGARLGRRKREVQP